MGSKAVQSTVVDLDGNRLDQVEWHTVIRNLVLLALKEFSMLEGLGI
jgi:hypothetical protein